VLFPTDTRVALACLAKMASPQRPTDEQAASIHVDGVETVRIIELHDPDHLEMLAAVAVTSLLTDEYEGWGSLLRVNRGWRPAARSPEP
jgi:hypothetical protein